MHLKYYILFYVLFSSFSLSAQMNPDSVYLHALPAIPPPKLHAGTGNDIIDSTAGHYVQISTYRNQVNMSSRTMFFYNNLRKSAERTYITRWLHDMLVKEPGFTTAPYVYDRRSEDEFEQYEGKIIRNIDYRSTRLFASDIRTQEHDQPTRLEKIGMFLHINTNEKIIRNNVLFETGDKLDPFLFADNERIIRQLSYIEDARIYVIEDNADQDTVDVVVITKDRWSRGFDMDMSDINEGRIIFYDKNILGLGQEVETNLLYDGDKDELFGYETGLHVNNIGGSFIRTGLSYLNSFDNKMISIRSEREFLTPSIKYAGGLAFTGNRLTDNFVFPDTTFINQKLNFHGYDYWFGRSFQLPVTSDGMYNRQNLYITARYNRNVFFERPEIDENERYVYHNKNLYMLNMTFVRLGYMKSRYIYGFGPTEDIPLGSMLETTIGYEDNQFFPRWYAGISISNNNYLFNSAYLKNSISFGGFINEGILEQGVLSLQTSGFSSLLDFNKYFLRQFFTLNYSRGIRRFDDEKLSISNRYGIRGLRSEEMRGIQKLMVQMETMLYAKKSWYGFRYAFYTMADIGWIGPGKNLAIKESFYSGFGIGIRVRNEHLVLPTLQFRLAWFPKIPDSASSSFFYINSEQRDLFDEFKVTAPDLLPYR